ncbi:hypothetical protein Bbelb_373430 [Branchiostoma belcheri]|nr:hypothetical protein Bbelb_373430 [Branchiostoma belcheri]
MPGFEGGKSEVTYLSIQCSERLYRRCSSNTGCVGQAHKLGPAALHVAVAATSIILPVARQRPVTSGRPDHPCVGQAHKLGPAALHVAVAATSIILPVARQRPVTSGRPVLAK